MSSYVCPECGLDYDTIHPGDAKVAVRSFPRRYRGALAAVLDDDDAAAANGSDGSTTDAHAMVRRRPSAEVWSALEYTAHVADVLGGLADTIQTMRTSNEAKPTVDFVDLGNRTAAERGELGVDGALAALDKAATALADELDRVGADEWSRTATFPWGERDILATARNGVHEGSHHLRDVEQALDTVRGRP